MRGFLSFPRWSRPRWSRPHEHGASSGSRHATHFFVQTQTLNLEHAQPATARAAVHGVVACARPSQRSSQTPPKQDDVPHLHSPFANAGRSDKVPHKKSLSGRRSRNPCRGTSCHRGGRGGCPCRRAGGAPCARRGARWSREQHGRRLMMSEDTRMQVTVSVVPALQVHARMREAGVTCSRGRALL